MVKKALDACEISETIWLILEYYMVQLMAEKLFPNHREYLHEFYSTSLQSINWSYVLCSNDTKSWLRGQNKFIIQPLQTYSNSNITKSAYVNHLLIQWYQIRETSYSSDTKTSYSNA